MPAISQSRHLAVQPPNRPNPITHLSGTMSQTRRLTAQTNQLSSHPAAQTWAHACTTSQNCRLTAQPPKPKHTLLGTTSQTPHHWHPCPSAALISSQEVNKNKNVMLSVYFPLGNLWRSEPFPDILQEKVVLIYPFWSFIAVISFCRQLTSILPHAWKYLFHRPQL